MELSCWHLGITSFWCQLGSSLGLEIPGYSFSGVPLCFPLLGFTVLTFCVELHISPLGFYYAYPFLGKYINHQKYKISYVPLDPVADYLYTEDLNTRLRFKPQFQTQISNSNLNFKTKIFPVLPGNPDFWVIETKGKRNETIFPCFCSEYIISGVIFPSLDTILVR